MGFSLILAIVGAVVGGICGAIIGRFNIYRLIQKYNSIGDSINPELQKEKGLGTGSKIIIILVGLFFAIVGAVLEFSNLSFNPLVVKDPRVVVFGGVFLAFGIIIIIAALLEKE